MVDEKSAAADVNVVILHLESLIERAAEGFYRRFASLGDVAAELDTLRASLAAEGTSLALIGFQIVLVSCFAGAIFHLANRTFRNPSDGNLRRLFSTLGAACLALAAGFVAIRFLTGSGLVVHTLRLWVLITIVGCGLVTGLHAVLMASRKHVSGRPSPRLAELARDLSIATIWVTAGLAMVATLRHWSAGPALVELVGTCIVSIPAFLLFGAVVWKHRRTLSNVIAGRRPRSRWQAGLARRWPGLVIWFLAIACISSEIAFTLGSPLPGSAVLFTVIIVLLTPHLDASMSNRARHATTSSGIPIAIAAARQTARFFVLVVAVSILAAMWMTPLADAFGVNTDAITEHAFEVAGIAIAGAFLWNAIGAVSGRALHTDPAAAGEDADAPRSRLGTLVPLLSGVAKSLIVALALLSILLSIGVNVWPLVTGLSVFGLAIGFGSQTLVKDVVSGLFFLIDDAFRFGEYIETSGAKGTVEKISVRSVSLRHQRGALATVPYGQIGKIQNFSRDWVVEKLTFRVAFDSDVDKIKKLFRQIGLDIAADPELAADLLEPFKSQGISEVEAGTLVINAKFKAKAGRQGVIRREVLRAVHRAFRENDIQAVAKPAIADAA